MQGREKRIHEIKIRLTDTEMDAAIKASIIEDRSIADFIHHGIGSYLFGYAYRLPECDGEGDKSNRGG